jgi:hypothetical protein
MVEACWKNICSTTTEGKFIFKKIRFRFYGKCNCVYVIMYIRDCYNLVLECEKRKCLQGTRIDIHCRVMCALPQMWSLGKSVLLYEK